MKKRTLMMVVLVLSLSLLVAGSAFARWGDGYGMRAGEGRYCWKDADRSPVDPETMTKFRKETLSLRDELLTKRLELSQEYGKEEPDADRIAKIRKEMVDIEMSIEKIADKYGMGGFGKGRSGRGGYARGYGECRAGCF